MRGPTMRTLALMALVPTTLALSGAERLNVAPQSRIWVDGSSTMRKWTCKVGAFDAAVDAQPNAVGAVLAGQKAVRTVNVSIPTAKMDCGNGTMNEHMLKALKATEFPTIEFKVTGYDVATGGAGVQGTLNGVLTLGGVQKPIAVAAEGREDGGALRVTGNATVRMKEFGLKPPTLMMGTLKVDEKVTVGFDLVLKN